MGLGPEFKIPCHLRGVAGSLWVPVRAAANANDRPACQLCTQCKGSPAPALETRVPRGPRTGGRGDRRAMWQSQGPDRDPTYIDRL